MSALLPASLLAVVALMAVHLFASRLRFLDAIPRSRFLSLSGGMAVAYVFLRILPDLAQAQLRLGERLQESLHLPGNPIYLVALAGLIVFYGLERLADRSRRVHRSEDGEDCPSPGVFWISMASYSVVNFAVGYLLLQREGSTGGRLLPFALAMALWFVVNDYGLRVQHKARYRKGGRWLLAAAVLAGWLVGLRAPLPDVALAVGLAFVAGGVVLNVLKEELPRERESRFWAFAAGAALYALLLLRV